MSDSFFQKKRKKGGSGGGGDAGPSTLRKRLEKKRPKRAAGEAEEDDFFENGRGKGGGAGNSDEDDDDDGEGLASMDLHHDFDKRDRLGSESEEDDVDETPAEARVRLAQAYLAGMRGRDEDDEGFEGGADAAEADRQNISARLQQDVSTRSTHLHNFLADRLVTSLRSQDIVATRGHQHSVTSAKIGPNSDCAWLLTAGKDGQVVRWRLRDGKMLEVMPRGVSNGAKPKGKPAMSKTSGAARRKMRAQEMKSQEGSSREEAGDKGKEKAHYLDLSPGQGHTGEIWTMSMSSDGKFLATGGKDQRICIWALPSRTKTQQQQADAQQASTQQSRFLKALGGHRDSITALGFRQGSQDLFSASNDRTLKLFDVSQLSYVETFFGHQEGVGDLDLLRGEVVVSAGLRDRSVRWWKVRDESQLVFRGGAKSKVRQVLEGGDMALTNGIDGGGDDDEDGPNPSSSTFSRAKEWVEGSIDCVAMVDEHSFLSGGDSGTISLWSLSKKKPVFTMPVAHGHHLEHVREGEEPIETPRWITSLACLPYGDIFASGSWDGEIRLWKLDRGLRNFKPLATIPALGFVNSLQLVATPAAGSSGNNSKKKNEEVLEMDKWSRRGGLRGGVKHVFSTTEEEEEEEGSEEVEQQAGDEARGKVGLIVAAAIGQEPTKGRWMRIKEATNGALIVPFHLKLES